MIAYCRLGSAVVRRVLILLALSVHQHVNHRRLRLLPDQRRSRRRRRVLRARLRHQDTYPIATLDRQLRRLRWRRRPTSQAAATSVERLLDVPLQRVQRESGAARSQGRAALRGRRARHILFRVLLHCVLPAQGGTQRSANRDESLLSRRWDRAQRVLENPSRIRYTFESDFFTISKFAQRTLKCIFENIQGMKHTMIIQGYSWMYPRQRYIFVILYIIFIYIKR